jgi:predicted exporter
MVGGGRPGIVLGIAGVVFAAAVVLLGRFEIDPNVENLLPSDDPTLELTRSLHGGMPPARSLVVVLRADKAGELVERLPGAVASLRGSPHLASVRATREEFAGPRVGWFKQSPLAFLPPESLEALRDRLAGPGRKAELESARRRLAEDPIAGKEVVLRDPLGTRWILQEAAERLSDRFPARLRPGTPYLVFDRTALLLATGREDSFVIPFSHALLQDVRTRLGAALAGSGVRFELAGGYVTAAWQEGAMRRDMTIQSVTSAVLVVAFLAWFTRSFLAAHLILVPVALGIVCALAFIGLTGPVTPLVASAAAVLIAQGIDFPVHLFSRFREARAEMDRDAAIDAAVRSLSRPLLGACLTTVAAFFSLCASDFPGFAQFGVVLLVGLQLCLLASMLVFPVLLRFVDGAARRPAGNLPAPRRVRAAPAAMVVLVGLAGWGVAFAKGVRMDLDLRNSMAPGDPGMGALSGLERDLGVSLSPVYALVDVERPLDELRRGVERLRSEGAIGAGDGPHALIPSVEQRSRIDEFRRVVEGWRDGARADLAALGFRPEPFDPALDELSRMIAAEAPGVEGLRKPDFASLRASVERGDAWIVTLLPSRSLWTPEARRRFDDAARAALGPGARLYSAYHLPDHAARTLEADLLRVLAITAAAVVILTLVSVGSFVDGLRALVPVALATGVTMGAAALLGGAINPMNLIAFPLVIGIGVDGGIHFLCRLRSDPRRDRSAALRDVGPGVWGSTATTLLGFGSIAFSSTPGLVSMGILVAVGAAASLLGTLVVLPALVPESVEPAVPGGVQ